MNRSSPYYTLVYRVDCRHAGGFQWEAMAAFDVEEVALSYARRCYSANPRHDYRVHIRQGRGWAQVAFYGEVDEKVA